MNLDFEVGAFLVAVATASLLFIQNLEMRKALRSAEGQRMFETFFTSMEISRFSMNVRAAQFNPALKKEIIEALLNLDEYDASGHRQRAEYFVAYLKSIFYSVRRRSIRSKFVMSIIGDWIKQYYQLRDEIKDGQDQADHLENLYFPEAPKSLRHLTGE